MHHYPQGHQATDFPRWFKSGESYDIEYEVRRWPRACGWVGGGSGGGSSTGRCRAPPPTTPAPAPHPPPTPCAARPQTGFEPYILPPPPHPLAPPHTPPPLLQTGFEPYILLPREAVPFYDERYRGYYWNKVSHLMHLSLQQGVVFAVHPSAFVVHVPHPKPSTKWLTRRSGQKERNHAMFTEGLEDMRWKHFVPVTSFPELCLPPGAERDAVRALGLI